MGAARVVAIPAPRPDRGIAFDVNVPGRVEVDIYAADDHRRLDLPPGTLSIPLGDRGEVAVVRLDRSRSSTVRGDVGLKVFT